MGQMAPDWLVGHFAVFGIQFQNWMLIVAGIVAIAIMAAARKW